MTEDEREKIEDDLLIAADKLAEAAGVCQVQTILAEWKHGESLAEMFKNQDDYDELYELRDADEKRQNDAEVIRDAMGRLSWGEIDKAAEILGDLIEDRPSPPSTLLRIRGMRRLANLASRNG